MDFPGYFLIVWDFINYAKSTAFPSDRAVARALARWSPTRCASRSRSHPVQPAVRALPESGRISMPDFDIDFCMNRRDGVIKYVSEKVRQDAGRSDHHLRIAVGEVGDQRRRARARYAVFPS